MSFRVTKFNLCIAEIPIGYLLDPVFVRFCTFSNNLRNKKKSLEK